MMRRGKKKRMGYYFFFQQGKIFVLFRGWWGYLISLRLSLSARVSARAVLLSRQLQLTFSFSRGCQRRARQDGGRGCLRLRV